MVPFFSLSLFLFFHLSLCSHIPLFLVNIQCTIGNTHAQPCTRFISLLGNYVSKIHFQSFIRPPRRLFLTRAYTLVLARTSCKLAWHTPPRISMLLRADTCAASRWITPVYCSFLLRDPIRDGPASSMPDSASRLFFFFHRIKCKSNARDFRVSIRLVNTKRRISWRNFSFGSFFTISRVSSIKY